MSAIQPISKSHFDILSLARRPSIEKITEEREWWAGENERVIGTVMFDKIDNDWSWIILGRDEKGLYRGIDMCVSLESQELASVKLKERLIYHSESGETSFPQGDFKGKRNDILKPLVLPERLHPNFKHLVEDTQYIAARRVIEETAYAFEDVDGNYVKDFQTTGFNGRLWELYLFRFLSEQRCDLYREFNRPDYCASLEDFRFGIEAVTVNPTDGENPPNPKNKEEVSFLLKDYMPLKFGSSLLSKLSKRYWEDSHMANVPLIFAIHDFHMGNSMIWSGPALVEYLYGLRLTPNQDANGLSVVEKTPIAEHIWKDKKCPSGFFLQPNTEHISAVLFSNASTLSKFNRMGVLAGFGDPTTIMYRRGFKENPDPAALTPIGFSSKVGPENYKEYWSEDVRIFHNPNALLPLPENLFKGCSNVFFKEGEFYEAGSTGRVITSTTWVLKAKSN